MKKLTVIGVAILLTAATIVTAQSFKPQKAGKKSDQQSLCQVGAWTGAMMLMFDIDAQPLVTFTKASITQDGRHLFVFASQWSDDKLRANCLTDEASRDQWVLNSISTELATQKWCLSGWAIDSKKVLDWPGGDMLHVEGHCR